MDASEYSQKRLELAQQLAAFDKAYLSQRAALLTAIQDLDGQWDEQVHGNMRREAFDRAQERREMFARMAEERAAEERAERERREALERRSQEFYESRRREAYEFGK